jgi:hypothetical protein
MAYPRCRLEIFDDPVDAPQKCFTSCYDVELLDDQTRNQRIITYIVASDGKIEKYIDIFHEGECTSPHCPLLKRVLFCRFRIGDLSEEEIETFKQKSNIGNHPDFVLQSEADIFLDTSDQRYEHQRAFERSVEQFELYKRNPRYDSHAKYMTELRRIAETIVAARPNDSQVSSSTVSAGSLSVCMAATGKGSRQTIPLDVVGEQATIDPADEPADTRTLEYGGKALKQIENSVFQGTYRAFARFKDPLNEIEDEKVERLVKDGQKWKDAVKEVFPDTPEESLDLKVDEVRQRIKRDRKGKI